MTDSLFAHIDWAGRRVSIEHAWIAPERRDRPLMVFLHEGLGSLSLWKDFPARMCDALDMRGLVYSRPAYGRSTPRPAAERWKPDFLQRQAIEVLPNLRATLDIAHQPVWLFGHSDGASIALLHAAQFPDSVAGLVVLAPHLFVEEVGLASIAQVRETYLSDPSLREKLARRHDDPDSAFWGWNDVWLSPAFRDWNIEADIEAIRCPVLAVQGLDDEYGTLAQVHAVAARVPQTRLVELPDCGHSPHRDQPERLIEVTRDFVRALET
jgi:pimeloyl-ACP methyl ester carboxylesterase